MKTYVTIFVNQADAIALTSLAQNYCGFCQFAEVAEHVEGTDYQAALHFEAEEFQPDQFLQQLKYEAVSYPYDVLVFTRHESVDHYTQLNSQATT